MDIFAEYLEFEEVDFSLYYNEDGEAIDLDELDDEELSNFISTLERHRKMMPEHYNVDIWEEYLRRCNELK